MQLGVIGLGTMGSNLARNAARTGAKVVVYNRTTEKTHDFMEQYADEGEFVACETIDEFRIALKPPRPVLLMVKAGAAIDAVIDQLTDVLEPGDIIIDGGNAHYPNTIRREIDLQEKGIRFIGMGVSGGEEGALHGPSMMPGGDKDAYEHIAPLLEQMAAEDREGGACVTHIGPGGAGHFVKMVHNGIEYGIMQLIAESYALLKYLGGFSNEQLAETYAAWNASDTLDSFLMEITAAIVAQKDDRADGYLIDVIADRAGQKGTGKWTTEAAMTYGVAIPTINAAVDARIISGSVGERSKAQSHPHALDEHDPLPPAEKMRSIVRNALECSVICAYNQGFRLIEHVRDDEQWGIDMSEVARIWRGGCIIRSVLLKKFQKAYGADARGAQAASEYLTGRFAGERQLDWRRAVQYGAAHGIPLPAMSASLSYYDALKMDRLPQNIIQAQRDFFGAHTYQRTDRDGTFHTNWNTSP